MWRRLLLGILLIIVDNQLSDSERIISSKDYLSQFQRSPSRNAGNVKYLRLIVAMLDQSQAYERFLISLRNISSIKVNIFWGNICKERLILALRPTLVV